MNFSESCVSFFRLNRKSASSLEKKAIYPTPNPAYNFYTESRMTHPPISESGIDQQYCCDDDQEENPYELYENLFPITGSSDQLLSTASREDRENTTYVINLYIQCHSVLSKFSFVIQKQRNV